MLMNKTRTEPDKPPVGLFLVNEYGEFGELMQVARLLARQISLSAVFVFARDDYGRLDEHTGRCKEAGFEALSLSPGDLADMRWQRRHGEDTQDGNLPDIPAGGLSVWQLLKGLLFVAVVLVFFVSAILPAVAVLIFGLPMATLLLIMRVSRRFKSTDPFWMYKSTLLAPLVEASRFPRAWMRYRRWKKHARLLLREVAPDIVVMGQDYPGCYNSIVARFARRRRIRSVIVPFAMYTARELAESFYSYPHHYLPRGPFGSLFKLLFPQWVFSYRGRKLLRMQISEIVALELHGLGWKSPWKPQTSDVELFCQSKQALDYYARLGKPQEQMHLTGSIWNDIVHASLARREDDRLLFCNILEMLWAIPRMRRHLLVNTQDAPDVNAEAISQLEPAAGRMLLRAVYDDVASRVTAMNEAHAKYGRPPVSFDYRIDPMRKVIVVAWPANQYPARPVPGVPDFETLSRRLVTALSILPASQKYEVWISLHPTVVGVLPPSLFEDAGLRLLRWPLIDFVHCADMFMATVSSTLIWAVQCRIPTINFDCYDYAYPEFDEMGCLTVTTLGALNQMLAAMVSSDPAIAAPSQQVAEYWSFPAGGSRERIVDGITGMLSTRRSGSPLVMDAT